MPDSPASPPSPGNCCSDMIRARTAVPKTLLQLTTSGVLVMTVGIGPARDGRGTAFYEQVVRFCPFCGLELLIETHVAPALA